MRGSMEGGSSLACAVVLTWPLQGFYFRSDGRLGT